IWTGDSWSVTGQGEAEQVRGLSVSHRFLAVLGVEPALGRAFIAADDDPSGERTVMLTDSYCRMRFGADRTAVGRRILLDGNAVTAARVAPQLQFLKDSLIGDISKTLWVLMGAVVIMLAIACANVANLFLVRADGRRQDLAVRAALGAGWARLARELLLESTLL